MVSSSRYITVQSSPQIARTKQKGNSYAPEFDLHKQGFSWKWVNRMYIKVSGLAQVGGYL